MSMPRARGMLMLDAQDLRLGIPQEGGRAAKVGADGGRRSSAAVVGAVAPRAHGPLLDANPGVVGAKDLVVAVPRLARAERRRLERGLAWGSAEEVHVLRVALSADGGHGLDAGRRCAMRPVAARARRRGQVARDERGAVD